MTFKEWLNNALSYDLICDLYKDRVAKAQSKKQFMDIVLEANGLEYLCKAKADGYGLPYDTILREFTPFINGAYEAKIDRENGKWYTSTMYCCLDEKSEIRVCNTATGFYGCKCSVVVPKNSFVQLYVDDECKLDITCHETSKCYISYSEGAEIHTNGEGQYLIEEIE